MSLNQLIDQNPNQSLRCDESLKIKCYDLRVFDKFSIDVNSSQNFNDISDIVLFDGSTERPVQGTTSIPVQFRKVGSIVSVLVPSFTVTSAEVTGTGHFRIKFRNTLPEIFKPIRPTMALPIQVENNSSASTTPGNITFTSSYNWFNVYADYALGNFTTGITGVSSIFAGIREDCYLTYHTQL